MYLDVIRDGWDRLSVPARRFGAPVLVLLLVIAAFAILPLSFGESTQSRRSLDPRLQHLATAQKAAAMRIHAQAPPEFAAAVDKAADAAGESRKGPDPFAYTFVSAGELKNICFSNPENRISCGGYIAGIVDYHRLMLTLGTAPTVNFCIPDGLAIEEITDVVLNYLTQNPQHDAFVAAPAVTLALFRTFPCRKKK